jgi:hypothetical protein
MIVIVLDEGGETLGRALHASKGGEVGCEEGDVTGSDINTLMI